MMEEEVGWEKALEQERKGKDVFFATHGQSPLPPEDKEKFTGLAYFPVNPDYRFELSIHEYDDKKVLRIQDTAGNMREFLQWGEFKFKIYNEECSLQAYKSNPDEDRFFIPFKDVTSGKETYGAGRYLDLNSMSDRTPDGKWQLDFNRAYNPWCAYSINYACPYVPPENWLRVPILAGEKNYALNKLGEKEK
jgi:uncharacterized protein (DUF1684 family)